MIVFCGDVSSTRQHSIRGTPLKKKMMICRSMIVHIGYFEVTINKHSYIAD